MVSSDLFSGLAGGASSGDGAGGSGIPGSPDNPRAAAALSTAIVALHAFLRAERDPADRASATQCLAKLESLRGKKMPGASLGANHPGGGGSGY